MNQRVSRSIYLKVRVYMFKGRGPPIGRVKPFYIYSVCVFGRRVFGTLYGTILTVTTGRGQGFHFNYLGIFGRGIFSSTFVVGPIFVHAKLIFGELSRLCYPHTLDARLYHSISISRTGGRQTLTTVHGGIFCFGIFGGASIRYFGYGYTSHTKVRVHRGGFTTFGRRVLSVVHYFHTSFG